MQGHFAPYPSLSPSRRFSHLYNLPTKSRNQSSSLIYTIIVLRHRARRQIEATIRRGLLNLIGAIPPDGNGLSPCLADRWSVLTYPSFLFLPADLFSLSVSLVLPLFSLDLQIALPLQRLSPEAVTSNVVLPNKFAGFYDRQQRQGRLTTIGQLTGSITD